MQKVKDTIPVYHICSLSGLDSNIAGIGYNLGFSDNSYFSKFFKKYTGTSPEEFRRGLQRTLTS